MDFSRNVLETKEFAKWLLGKVTLLVSLEFFLHNYDKYVIDDMRDMGINLNMLRKSYSPSSLETGTFGLAQEFFLDFEREMYKPRNYFGACSFYDLCSWETNKRFRKLHDEISAYLN